MWWRDMLMSGRMSRILSEGEGVQIEIKMPMLLVMQTYNLERNGCASALHIRVNTGKRQP